MKYFICVLFLIGQFCCAQTQDKNGLTKLVTDAVNDAISETTISGGSLKIGHEKVEIQFRSADDNDKEDIDDPVILHDIFNGFSQNPELFRRIDIATRITEKATEFIQARKPTEKLTLPRFRTIFRSALAYICPSSNAKLKCDFDYPYRTINGTCNNKEDPRLGSALTGQPRFLDPNYGDKFNIGITPRIKDKKGKPLPSSRKISNAISKSMTSAPRSSRITLLHTHFGQMVSHDVIATPVLKDSNGKQIKCCKGNTIVKRPECFSFATPKGDFSTTCMHFVRSQPALNPGCEAGARQQLNQATSYLDLSTSYGSSEERNDKLRRRKGGELKESDGNLLFNAPSNSTECVNKGKCFMAGDHRHSEVPMLDVVHLLFDREHNRIARELQGLNPGWDDEKLYQEARKILTGIYQHIVYNEYLPIIVGKVYNYYGLRSSLRGHKTLYHPYLDPRTYNEFGVAAFRFGHSQVGSFVGASSMDYRELRKRPLEKEYFNIRLIRDKKNQFGVDRIGRWMLGTTSSKSDRFFTPTVRDRLFETKPGNGFDLSALNIQRGRDHGIPGYNKFRQFCGLRPANHFGTGPLGLIDHDEESAKGLASVYSHPDDIDLFIGGLSERPGNDAIVGPLFSCMIALQFGQYKFGDRFFYENNFAKTGFTEVDSVISEKALKEINTRFTFHPNSCQVM